MGAEDPIEEIRRRWRSRELALEWMRLPREARDAVIGEIEEWARESGDEARTARLVAADALEAMQNPSVFEGLLAVEDDVRRLLAEIDRLRKKVGPR